MIPSPIQHVEDLLEDYENNADHNDALHRLFTELAWADPVLAAHRSHIETHQLGFGDAAFHYLWKLLVEHASRHERSHFLEIGVYKGQVISLWALLLRESGRQATLHAISPMCGDPLPSPWATRLLRWFSPRFRDRFRNADFYECADYEPIATELFNQYGLAWSDVQLWKGLSHEPAIRRAAAELRYQIIYIDGDHSRAGATADFSHYGRLLAPGGFLVADDAGLSLPGTVFWKGHPGVTEAADEVLPALGLVNVLNIGHNRVFQQPL
jgi:hypothetical protein